MIVGFNITASHRHHSFDSDLIDEAAPCCGVECLQVAFSNLYVVCTARHIAGYRSLLADMSLGIMSYLHLTVWQRALSLLESLYIAIL